MEDWVTFKIINRNKLICDLFGKKIDRYLKLRNMCGDKYIFHETKVGGITLSLCIRKIAFTIKGCENQRKFYSKRHQFHNFPTSTSTHIQLTYKKGLFFLCFFFFFTKRHNKETYSPIFFPFNVKVMGNV